MPALHIAVIQREQCIVVSQIEGHSMPCTIVYGMPSNAQYIQVVGTVQLEPEEPFLNLNTQYGRV